MRRDLRGVLIPLDGLAVARWYEQPIVVVSLETTGLDATRDRVVEVGFARFEWGRLVAAYGSLVNPRMSIPKTALPILGRDPRDYRTGPPIREVLRHVIDAGIVRDAVPCSWAPSFSQPFLLASIAGMRVQDALFEPARTWLDAHLLVRGTQRPVAEQFRSYRLADACRDLGLEHATGSGVERAICAGAALLHVAPRIRARSLRGALARQREFDARSEASLLARAARHSRGGRA